MKAIASSCRIGAVLFVALACSFFVFSIESSAAEITNPLEEAESFTLSNGLQVVVLQDHSTQLVTQMIWYKAGSADDPIGQSGIAHFLEHLMFIGTTRHPGGEFTRAVVKVGGLENAFTAPDWTGYFERFPRDQLAAMMDFEADRMTNLVLNDQNVIPARAIVLDSYETRVTHNPEARLTEKMMAALYSEHPYGRPGIGLRAEIEKLGREDALAFYRRFYAPNNAVLVIAGDTSLKEVRPLAEATYGKIAARAVAAKPRPQEPEYAAPRTVTLTDPEVTQPKLKRFYRVPSEATGSANESASLEVLAQLLGGGSNSYLYRALITNSQLVFATSVVYSRSSLGSTRFEVSATPRPGVGFQDVEQTIDQALSFAAQEIAPAEDLDQAKTQLINLATLHAQRDQVTLARWYGAPLTVGLKVEDVKSWPERIRAVTAEQVCEAARKWLDKNRSVTGYLANPANFQFNVAKPAPSPPVGTATFTSSQDFGRRVALVIGNSAYRNAPMLPNPTKDAAAIADALRRLGFQSVVLATDLGREKMIAALWDFSRQAEAADWALVYFAGHGMEVGGVNYLVPVDATVETDRDMPFAAVSLDQVLNAADRAQKLKLVILDACRTNPYAVQMKRTAEVSSRGLVERGFARIEPQSGTLVVYAAKDGETASDGNGPNSPFTSALLKNLQIPGIEVRRLFDNVRDDVQDLTQQRQLPFMYGSVSGKQDYYFLR